MVTKKTAGLIAVFILFLTFTTLSYSDEDTGTLFVNLTTDDTWSAGMAINFAGMAIKRGHKVTVFLNAYAVRLVDTSITHNINGSKNKTVQEMISDIQKKGVKVIVCGGCIKKAGITKDQLLKGVVIGNADIIFPALFESNTKVMSW